MTVVTEHLERTGVKFEFLPHPASLTALAEARALGLDPDEVLKAVVLDVETGHAVAVIPASERLDMALVREALGEPRAELATEREIHDAFPEFEPGAVPALPSLVHVPVVIDPSVFTHRRVTFAAGAQRGSVRVGTEPLLHGATVTVTPIVDRGLRA